MCTEAVYQVMGLPIFQYRILASTIVYHYHKNHLVLSVSISVPSLVGMHPLPSAYTSIGPSDQYSEKPSQSPSSEFSTVPSILPSEHPTLSPSGLHTVITFITTRTSPSRYTTQLPSKPYWFSIVLLKKTFYSLDG